MIDDVVFELNGWMICNLPDDHTIRDLSIFVHHTVCEKTRRNRYKDKDSKNEISWLRGEYPRCWTCDDLVPMELQAIMHLYEWGKDFDWDQEDE